MLRLPQWTLCLILAAAPAAPALASGEGRLGELDWSLRLGADVPREPLLPALRQHESEPEDLPEPPPTFGDRGTNWLTIGGGLAHDFSESADGVVNVTWSHFLSRNVEWVVEAGGWALDQPGSTEGGLSVSNVYRWHFINEDRYSLFVDAGVGLLVAGDDVPEGGTSFNFLPRLGAGATFRLREHGSERLVVGARWHHISNARIRGQDDNPARDGLMLYAGVQFPF